MKKIKIICSVFGVLIFLASCSVIYRDRYCIFSNISEFEIIESEFLNQGEVEKYNDTSKDENIKELQYVAHYAAYYTCEDFEFEIFAYEFENSDASREYHKNVSVETDKSVSMHRTVGITQTKLVLIDNTMAYSAFYSNADAEQVEHFFCTAFSKVVF